MPEPITIRPFSSTLELRCCEELQKTVWQYGDIEVVPHHVFVAAQKAGGDVLGAFDGDQPIGFTLAFPALRLPTFYLHSHMTAVIPEYQNRAVGRRLKLAQRDRALLRGISLIEWTFDPLQFRNAHFNIVRLGAIVRRYLPNLYGPTSSTLQRGLPTDRLVAEWWLTSSRVQNALQASSRPPSGSNERICIPTGFEDICRLDPARALEIQAGLRSRFEQLFAAGYAVTGFALDQTAATYILERP